MTTREQVIRERIAKLQRIQTCVGCKYWKTCFRTKYPQPKQGFSEMLCQAEIDAILAITDESGNRLLLVRDPDQTLPDKNKGHTWYKDDLGEAGKIGYDLALGDLLAQGWVKVI